ncbi:hypothetical protein K7X08_030605 [Anisodus acutangulus]|uniref:Glucan endo-1,3-beta-D-glucosidase n=1 Tax=Anisodus acutangulus TaxID=402998 RepID=A0A9Q1QU78_9SOLA|nr:hypothetical protein K7X08_030605 [Anisodus acutangulus]
MEKNKLSEVRAEFGKAPLGGTIRCLLWNDGEQLAKSLGSYTALQVKKHRKTEANNPNHGALQALRGSNIEVMLGLPNVDVKHIASGMEHAKWWLQKNVKDFWPDVKIKYIAVGNEISPVTGTSYLTSFLIPALIGNSYPLVKVSSLNISRHNLDWQLLSTITGANFSYHALFTTPNVVVQDGSRQYGNLLDAMLDFMYATMDRSRGGSVGIVVSESGWPSAGAFGATIDNAATYLRNLIQHVREGSPRNPGPIETYIFVMFDENNKNPELEKHFGLFSPTCRPNITSTLEFQTYLLKLMLPSLS